MDYDYDVIYIGSGNAAWRGREEDSSLMPDGRFLL